MKRTTFRCPQCSHVWSAKYLAGKGAEPLPVKCPNCSVILRVVIGPTGPETVGVRK